MRALIECMHCVFTDFMPAHAEVLTLIPYCSAVTQSNNFIQAVQEEPFGDIVISRGTFL